MTAAEAVRDCLLRESDIANECCDLIANQLSLYQKIATIMIEGQDSSIRQLFSDFAPGSEIDSAQFISDFRGAYYAWLQEKRLPHEYPNLLHFLTEFFDGLTDHLFAVEDPITHEKLPSLALINMVARAQSSETIAISDKPTPTMRPGTQRSRIERMEVDRADRSDNVGRELAVPARRSSADTRPQGVLVISLDEDDDQVLATTARQAPTPREIGNLQLPARISSADQKSISELAKDVSATNVEQAASKIRSMAELQRVVRRAVQVKAATNSAGQSVGYELAFQAEVNRRIGTEVRLCCFVDKIKARGKRKRGEEECSIGQMFTCASPIANKSEYYCSAHCSKRKGVEPRQQVDFGTQSNVSQ